MRPRKTKRERRARNIQIPVNAGELEQFDALADLRGEESLAKAVRDTVREYVEEHSA